jgi:hypothetical protein
MRNMPRTFSATCYTVALLAAVLALGLAATVYAADEVDPTTLTPEAAWAAMPTLADLAGALPQPTAWWPGLPEFNVGPLDPAPAPGERFYLVQRFTRYPIGVTPSYLEITITVFKNRESAHNAFRGREQALATMASGLPGPDLGNERRYFLFPPGPSQETQLRYRVGPFVGRVSLVSSQPASVDELAACGKVLEAKLTALRFGQLTAPALPADFDQLMPPPRVDFEIGQTLVSAVLPPQSWAMMTSGSPEKLAAKLTAGGLTQLYYRRYLINLLPGEVLDVTLWPFKDAMSASAWVQGMRDQVAADGTPVMMPGKVGPQAVMTYSRTGQYYELQFAKGNYVGDVIGQAPFQAEVDSLCQVSVRRLAERWYAALPAPLVLSNTP